MNKDLEQYVEKLSQSHAVHAVRNTFLESLHAGDVPLSEVGDFSDVKVVTPTEEIPWTKLSRLNDPEMKKLMKEVVNNLYTILLPIIADKRSGKLDHLIGLGDLYASEWDEAKINPEFGLPELSSIEEN